MATDDDALPPGSEFGAYTIVRTLGAGAFGAVYEALRQPLGKRVALKVLHKGLPKQSELTERFLREARAAARLEHPHIVDVTDVGEINGRAFLAMEYLDGENLAAKLKRERRLSVPEAVDLLVPLCSAVEAVHHAGIVHRDLKPDNLYLTRTRAGAVTPKLLDFGIAKVRDEAQHSLTATSALLGTPHYMSPEQARESKGVDGRSDQWSLGVILYECLVGAKPFHADSLLGILTAITALDPMRPRDARPDIPEGLQSAILRALRRNPAERFASVRDFGAALLPFASPAVQHAWSAELGAVAHAPTAAAFPAVSVPPASSPSSPSTLHPAVTTPTRASRAPMVALLTVAAAALGATGYVLTRERPTVASAVTPPARAEVEAGAPAVVHEAVDAGSPTVAQAEVDAGSPTVAQAEVDAGAPTVVAAESVDAGSASEDDAPRSRRHRASREREPTPERAPEPASAAGDRSARPSREAVTEAMRAVTPQVRACGDGSGGRAAVTVVFASDGSVVAAGVAPPFAGTPVATCIVAAVRAARVAPFTERTYSVRYGFGLPTR